MRELLRAARHKLTLKPARYRMSTIDGYPITGALAQLGERNTGSVEVSGSIPLGSTKSKTSVSKPGFFL